MVLLPPYRSQLIFYFWHQLIWCNSVLLTLWPTYDLRLQQEAPAKWTFNDKFFRFSHNEMERSLCNRLTCPTEETPLSVLPHREYCDSCLSPTKSLVFSRALKISDCKEAKYSTNNQKYCICSFIFLNLCPNFLQTNFIVNLVVSLSCASTTGLHYLFSQALQNVKRW